MFVAICGLGLASCAPGGGVADGGPDGGGGALCRSDRECSGAGLVCDRSRGRCVQCVGDTDCASGQVCARNECAVATPCSTSRMCPGQVCDPGRGRCVDCVEDLDCPSTDRCETSRCVARPVPCVSDRECSALNRVCDPGRGFCVECVRDADCPGETFCSPEALCQPTVCAAGTMSCASETRARVCNSNGSAATDTDCTDGTRCASGRCVAGPAPDVVTPPLDAAVEAGVDVLTPPTDVASMDASDAPAPGPDASDVIAPRPDAADVVTPPPDVPVTTCASDEACSNGVFCDGAERCRPGAAGSDARGCAPALGPACTAPDTCLESPPLCVAPMMGCSSTMVECDGLPFTVCETNLQTDANNCGACAMRCEGMGARCAAGRCDGVASISAYLYETCAVRDGGVVVCWDAARRDQALVPMLTDAVDVVVGSFAACARTRDNAVRCWGNNESGQLGDGTTTMSSTPVLVAGVTDARQLAGGDGFFCALRASGSVVCWGAGTRGQLGNGSFANSPRPVLVAGLTDAVEVRAGRYHACARLRSGSVRCWGDNTYQQLHDGSMTNRAAPVAPVGVPNALEISLGNYTTYVRTATGVSAWGYNSDGEVGDGTTTFATTVRTVAGLGADVRAIAAGALHACALLASGEARCWGANSDSQLGDGTTMQRTTPVTFMAPAGIRQLAAGYVHTCARYDGNEVRCWGRTDTAVEPIPL